MKTANHAPDPETEALKKSLVSRGLNPDATIAKAKVRVREFLTRQAKLRDEGEGTNKSAFFKLLRKSAPPSEQPTKGTKATRHDMG